MTRAHKTSSPHCSNHTTTMWRPTCNPLVPHHHNGNKFIRETLGFFRPVVLKESIDGGVIFHPSLLSRNENNEKNCDGKFRSYSPKTIRKDSDKGRGWGADKSAGKPLLFCSSI
ncbi:hypothetical protein CDAR_552441 [Caerostris darwini]|uniref:Uncharacterized protein n=1 Tax=Caerostris darwini TaxID=1538125 RepID=A0AAV4NKE7_9ARAC|nr:hypothetical protein CDAR_552441 [Caerostris darwini]